THRRLDPFGNPRAAAVAWPTLHGFVDGIVDATGLIHLGAREYEPATGRFLSDDSVTNYADPLQLGGYGYGSNNPETYSDPDGTRSHCHICDLVRHAKPKTARRIIRRIGYDPKKPHSKPNPKIPSDGECSTVKACEHEAEQRVLDAKQCTTIRACDALTEDNTWHPTKKPMHIIIHHENDGFTFGLCSTGGFAAGPAWGVSECLAVDKHGLFTYT